MLLDDFIYEVKKRELNVYSIEIYEDGILRCSHFFKPKTKVNQYSVTKAFTSAAAGLAVKDGFISENSSVCDILREHMPEKPDSTLYRLTLKDLLTMQSGHEKACLMPGQRDRYSECDWIKYALSRPMSSIPGTHFTYDNSSSYLICAMLEKKLGYPLSDYLDKRLFAPLGIFDYSFYKCPLGYIFGGSDLRISTSDMAKIGLLYSGCYPDIISSDWIFRATEKHTDTDWEGEGAFGYGYQLWMCSKSGVFRAEGALGQLCIIDPKGSLVIALNSCEPKCATNNTPIFDFLWDTVYDRLK